MTNELKHLAKCINQVKRQRAGQPGGAFIINEFGQVICPIADASLDRYYVGDCQGEIAFSGPDGNTFTLNDEADLTPGEDWSLPYLGLPYNLSGDGEIYFQVKDGDDTERVRPPCQDEELIQAIRRIRGWGGVRFLVNPHGIVLTKSEEGAFNWRPKYVGRINYDLWFPREDA